MPNDFVFIVVESFPDFLRAFKRQHFKSYSTLKTLLQNQKLQKPLFSSLEFSYANKKKILATYIIFVELSSCYFNVLHECHLKFKVAKHITSKCLQNAEHLLENHSQSNQLVSTLIIHYRELVAQLFKNKNNNNNKKSSSPALFVFCCW